MKVEKKRVKSSTKKSKDIKVLQKEPEQLAKLLKWKRMTLRYTQADVGLTWAFSLERLSQMAICHFESLQLDSRTSVSYGPCWRDVGEEANTNENLQEMYKVETLM